MIGKVWTVAAAALGAGGGLFVGNLLGRNSGSNDVAAYQSGQMTKSDLIQRRETIGSQAMFGLAAGGIGTLAAGAGALFTGHPILVAATGISSFFGAAAAARATAYERVVDPTLNPSLPTPMS
jgi:hypothetical protein